MQTGFPRAAWLSAVVGYCTWSTPVACGAERRLPVAGTRTWGEAGIATARANTLSPQEDTRLSASAGSVSAPAITAACVVLAVPPDGRHPYCTKKYRRWPLCATTADSSIRRHLAIVQRDKVVQPRQGHHHRNTRCRTSPQRFPILAPGAR